MDSAPCGSGHWRLDHPAGSRPVIIPASPSDHRWYRNARSDMRRVLPVRPKRRSRSAYVALDRPALWCVELFDQSRYRNDDLSQSTPDHHRADSRVVRPGYLSRGRLSGDAPSRVVAGYAASSAAFSQGGASWPGYRKFMRDG